MCHRQLFNRDHYELVVRLMVLAHNLNYVGYTDNLNHIPDLSGQPGQNPGFLFKLKWPVTDYFPDFPNGF